MRILYLVHDVSDPSVAKRVAMLRAGGASVTVAGFRRTAETVIAVDGCPATDFGQTYNGGFAQRALSVLRQALCLGRHRALFQDADVILARTLEMLALGVRGRAFCAPRPVLVYESLDIHRLLLKEGPVGSLLRQVEGWLANSASAVITSSPAFVREYFQKRSRIDLPIYLLENKVYDPAIAIKPFSPRPGGPPWRIGWFGAIRCRKSFEILTGAARESGGLIEVVIRGRPSLDQIPDFHAVTASTPGLVFAGPYKNPDDLQDIYRDVHFSWAIDMFEEGLNSAWLLPNRIYEGGLYDAVPIAINTVETGKYLAVLNTGITFAGPPSSTELIEFFRGLTAESYRALEEKAAAVPRLQWMTTGADCVDLVRYLGGLRP